MTSAAWSRAEHRTRQTVRHHPATRATARVGLLARGALYAVVAVLAFRLAFRPAHETADKNGALLAVARQPFGKVLLAVLALGFAAYAAWMLARIVMIDEDTAAKTWAKRASAGFRAVVYGVLAFSAVDAIRRAGSAAKRGGNRQQQEWSARVLGWPGGRLIVAAVGLALLAGAVSFIVRGVTEKWRDHLDLSSATPATRRTVRVVAWLGWLGRGAAFGLVALFIVRAAWDFNAQDSVGLDGALRRTVHATWGPLLLVLLALGLLAFGCYSMIEARYRRVTDA